MSFIFVLAHPIFDNSILAHLIFDNSILAHPIFDDSILAPPIRKKTNLPQTILYFQYGRNYRHQNFE